MRTNLPSRSWLCWTIVAAALAGVPVVAAACPFCLGLKPTLTQRREEAEVTALGEFLERDGKQVVFRVHQILHGQAVIGDVERLKIESDAEWKPGALALLFGHAIKKGASENAVPKITATKNAAKSPPKKLSPAELSWSTEHTTELGFAYIARAPSLRKDVAERLRYFAKYLEHDDPLLAEDAYQEFGHAPYDKVSEATDALDQAKLRAWLADEKTRDYRKGFFGVALGLAKSADDREANAKLMRKLIDDEENDFLAGFDGVLGGYLLLTGEKGLKHLEERYLANAKAADGHVRHTLKALRFYYEEGRGISRDRQRAALRLLLDRPEFAAVALVDLARWEDWSSVDRVAALYGRKEFDTPAVKRSIVGFLLACPNETAAKHLDRLRRADPKTVADAEKSLSLFGGSR